MPGRGTITRSRFNRTMCMGSLALVALAPAALAQDAGDDSAYLAQAEAGEESSKVYYPDAITPESVAQARARAAQQEQQRAEQIDADRREQLSQVSNEGRNGRVEQLTDGSSDRALAQLSEAEKQVLLEAIEGTDICDNPPPVAAIRELCRTRIETRSEDFAGRPARILSAEERLLGEGLENTTAPGLDRIIERLARNVGKAGNLDNQAIASVALADSTLAPDGSEEPAKPESELSPETQSLINALIQQLTNGGGA